MVAALVGQTPKQVQDSINNNQYSPYEPVPVAVGVSQDTVQFLQTHQSEYPGVTVQTVAQRTYPQGGTTATHVLGYVGDITSSYLAAHSQRGYTQGSQIGVSGIEAQYEPYLKGVTGRQALSVDAGGDVVGTLELHGAQIGDTVVLEHRYRIAAGRSRMTSRRRSWPTGRRRTRSTGASCHRRSTERSS